MLHIHFLILRLNPVFSGAEPNEYLRYLHFLIFTKSLTNDLSVERISHCSLWLFLSLNFRPSQLFFPALLTLSLFGPCSPILISLLPFLLPVPVSIFRPPSFSFGHPSYLLSFPPSLSSSHPFSSNALRISPSLLQSHPSLSSSFLPVPLPFSLLFSHNLSPSFSLHPFLYPSNHALFKSPRSFPLSTNC